MASAQVQVSDETSGAMQQEMRTRVSMNNQTPFQMMINRSINWSGSGGANFLLIIAPNTTAGFYHGQSNSMAAVQYGGLNAAGVSCAWILAWDAPANNTSPLPPNRVYVVCGSKAQIDALSFEQIRFNLEVAGTQGSYIDVVTKTQVNAAIVDQTNGTASLNAAFNLFY